MATNQLAATRQRVQTPSGWIAMPSRARTVALFAHGVLLNGHLWRHQLAHLRPDRIRLHRRGLLAHGDTEAIGNQDLSVTANARMLEEFL